jgi:alpha-L-fucosidase 2
MQNFTLPNITCYDSATLRIRGLVAQPGMLYELLLRAQASPGAKVSCAPAAVVSMGAPLSGRGTSNATLTISGASGAWLTWVGDTEYDMAAGDAAHGFSFRGPDPHAANVQHLTSIPATYSAFRAAHVADMHATLGKFKLSFGPPSAHALATPTDQLLAAYAVDAGDPYLEWLTFNYGRYMLASSARSVLPTNLLGKWSADTNAPWSADYRRLPIASAQVRCD